jgi:coronatine-insensitive protein 1
MPDVPNLRKLDFKYTLLSCEGHIQLLNQCHLLEELQTRNTLGNEAMETIARSCKESQKLRVEDDETGAITQRGLVAVAQGCANLVQLIVFVTSISNTALAMVGQGCPRLTNFQIVLELTPRPDYAPPNFPLQCQEILHHSPPVTRSQRQ